MTTCEHLDFVAMVEVNRITDVEGGPVIGLSVDVTARCAACDEPVVFHGVGLPVGLAADRPTLSINGTELHCPARMQSDDPLFGLGMTGFAVRIEQGSPGSSTN